MNSSNDADPSRSGATTAGLTGPASLSRSVTALRARLDTVKRAWTADNYESLLKFYVQIIPRLLDAERCGIFVLDSVRQRLLSKAGTGLRAGEIDAPETVAPLPDITMLPPPPEPPVAVMLPPGIDPSGPTRISC